MYLYNWFALLYSRSKQRNKSTLTQINFKKGKKVICPGFQLKLALKSLQRWMTENCNFCIDKALVSVPSCHSTQRNLVFRTHIAKKIGLLLLSHSPAPRVGGFKHTVLIYGTELGFCMTPLFLRRHSLPHALQVLPLVLRVF